MKNLFSFYLKNFRAVHHIVFILMTFGFLKIISLIFPFYEVIFKLDGYGVFLQLVTLAFCFFFNEKALNKVGITDDYMSDQLVKFKNKKEVN
jgi:hypothetical protein